MSGATGDNQLQSPAVLLHETLLNTIVFSRKILTLNLDFFNSLCAEKPHREEPSDE